MNTLYLHIADGSTMDARLAGIMLKQIRSFFLNTYDRQEYLVRQKARVLLLFYLSFLLVIIPAYQGLMAYFNYPVTERVAILFLALFYVLMIAALRAGRFALAGHGLIMSSLAVLWFIMFVGSAGRSPIAQLDTVIITAAVLALSGLVVTRRAAAIIWYYTANALVFALFMFVVSRRVELAHESLVGYTIEMLIFMGLSGLISYQTFSINARALERERRAEDEIRRSEALFRGIVEESPFAMVILNNSGEFEYVSRDTTPIFGYILNEIPTIDEWWRIAYPDDGYRTKVMEEMRVALERAAATHYPVMVPDTRITCRDGSLRDLHVRIATLDAGARYLVFLDDITDRKNSERAISASEARYRMLYESMMEGFVNLDLEGHIIEFNEAYRAITGYEARELAGMTNWDITPQAWHGRQRRIIEEQVLTRGYSDIFEKEYRRKDGTLVPVELRLHLVRDDGGAGAGYWSMVRDISARKQAEREILKASKIESLGVFAGGIAHDFNNLLTAIIGNITLARADMDAADHRYLVLSEAEKACLRAGDLTHQLLTFSKGGAPIKKTTSVTDLLHDTVEFVLSGSPIRLDTTLPADLWNAEIDEGQISQVFHNLALNAREAMPQGGTLSIKAENRRIEKNDSIPLPPGTYLRLTIADTGVGIPAPVIPKIYDPFFTTKREGTGLGLSVTYSIVKKHGGHIAVDSTVGAGTIFTIHLPATLAAAVDDAAAPAGTPPRGGRVLLMDDETMILDVGERILARLGLETVRAASGEEAIEHYRRARESGHPFDLVIMDLTIPGRMGGREAIQHIRDYDPAVRALVSSGYSNDPVMANFRDYGFMGIVAKPYRFEDLRDVIALALR